MPKGHAGDTRTSRAGGGNGFFSTISGGFAHGIGTVGAEVLPRWVGKELGVQTGDQLNESTYHDKPTGGAPAPGLVPGVSDRTLLIGTGVAAATGLIVFLAAR